MSQQFTELKDAFDELALKFKLKKLLKSKLSPKAKLEELRSIKKSHKSKRLFVKTLCSLKEWGEFIKENKEIVDDFIKVGDIKWGEFIKENKEIVNDFIKTKGEEND